MPIFTIFYNCIKFQNHGHIIELVSFIGHTIISPKNTVVKDLKSELLRQWDQGRGQSTSIGELFCWFNEMVAQFMATIMNYALALRL